MSKNRWLVLMMAAAVACGLVLTACEDGDDDGDDSNGEALLPPAVDVSGTWAIRICDNPATLTLAQSGNAVNGSGMDQGNGALEIHGTVSADQFAFSVINTNDIDFVGHVTVNGGSMNGTISQQTNTCSMTGTKM
jgi:hypothetical protein